jgi:DNA-binding NarL/FixJ family response regulator
MNRANTATINPRSRQAKPSQAPPVRQDRRLKRIVIVDDHPLLRKGLGRIINSSNSFTVCGEAGDGRQALAIIRSTKPNLVIVDIGLPDGNGIELTKKIRTEFPKLPVLILSMHEEPLYAARALRAGAQGYIVKQEAIERIVEAVRKIFDGQRYVSAMVSKQIGTGSEHDEELCSANRVRELTERELEVLELIGKGHSIREIAQKLHLSRKTVESHRAHIKEKLNLRNARQVARFATQWVAEHVA